MKFILAPDSFKESMSSKEDCDAMERRIKKIIPTAECIKVPMADGGEGTVEALVEATNGTIHSVVVTAPLGNKVEAIFGILGNKTTAVIEMASASGIHLVKREERNPLITTTFGTGEIIKAALDSLCNYYKRNIRKRCSLYRRSRSSWWTWSSITIFLKWRA